MMPGCRWNVCALDVVLLCVSCYAHHGFVLVAVGCSIWDILEPVTDGDLSALLPVASSLTGALRSVHFCRDCLLLHSVSLSRPGRALTLTYVTSVSTKMSTEFWLSCCYESVFIHVAMVVAWTILSHCPMKCVLCVIVFIYLALYHTAILEYPDWLYSDDIGFIALFSNLLNKICM